MDDAMKWDRDALLNEFRDQHQQLVESRRRIERLCGALREFERQAQAHKDHQTIECKACGSFSDREQWTPGARWGNHVPFCPHCDEKWAQSDRYRDGGDIYEDPCGLADRLIEESLNK